MFKPQTASLATGLLATALLSSIASAQNVGIGTTTPKSKLSVNGSTASGGMAIGDATYTSTTGTVAPLNGAIIQGFTGIGTTAPAMRLHLQGTVGQADDSSIFIQETGTMASNTGVTGIPGIYLRATDVTNLNVDAAYAQVLFQSIATGTGATGANTGMIGLHRGVLPGNGDPLTALGFTTSSGTGPSYRMYISETGNVGINTTAPTEAKLVVRGLVAGTFGSGQAYNWNSGTTLQAQVPGPAGFSIYASNSIAAAGNLISGGAIIATSSLTPSDNRLKNIIGESNTEADLKTLNKIKITNYTMKDASVLGSAEIKKVIAQQVEEVYPQAVTKTDGYLPDIYMSGTSQAKDNGLVSIETGKAHGLKAGDKIKVFTADGEPVFGKVETTDGASFTTKLELVQDGEKVFVYGRQVSDLRTVDYDALSMLNVSATQELAKEVTELKAENEKLKAQVQKFDALAARLEAMEKSVAASTNGREETVSTVALTK
jgi:hypothetical protein